MTSFAARSAANGLPRRYDATRRLRRYASFTTLRVASYVRLTLVDFDFIGLTDYCMHVCLLAIAPKQTTQSVVFGVWRRFRRVASLRPTASFATLRVAYNTHMVMATMSSSLFFFCFDWHFMQECRKKKIKIFYLLHFSEGQLHLVSPLAALSVVFELTHRFRAHTPFSTLRVVYDATRR